MFKLQMMWGNSASKQHILGIELVSMDDLT